MSYFPLRILPEFRKLDASGSSGFSGSINASDYNFLADEIVAIERFLGTEPATTDDEVSILNKNPDSKNLIGVLRRLVDGLNSFVSKGLLESSGYVHDGQRMLFPDAAWATFLKTTPAATDRVISVDSTAGFPESGVLTILNDLDASAAKTSSTVEWIRYNGKSGSQFLNCERGYLGTTIGSHTGSLKIAKDKGGSKNELDQCLTLPIGLTLCNRRYPSWRFKQQYASLPLGLFGSLIEIKRQLRRAPGDILVTPTALGESYETFIEVAESVGVLADGPGGNKILQSADLVFQANKQLTWQEASDLVDGLIEEELATLVKTPTDWNVNKNPYIPVFQGRLAVSHSVAALTMNPVGTVPVTTTTTTTTPTPTTPTPTPVPVPASTPIDPFSDGILATKAIISGGQRVFRGPDGSIYFSEGHRVRKVETNGKITTVAGGRTAGYSGDEGLAINAKLNTPMGIYVNSNNEIFIADCSNHAIRKIDRAGWIRTIAGTGVAGNSGVNGPATSAQLKSPRGVYFDISRNSLLIADTGNRAVKAINSLNNMVMINAGFISPSDVVADGLGNIYVADYARIVKINANSSDGAKFAGLGSFDLNGQPAPRLYGDTGLALNAIIDARDAIAIDSRNNVYWVDLVSAAVRLVVVDPATPKNDGTNATYQGSEGKTFTAVSWDRGTIATDTSIDPSNDPDRVGQSAVITGLSILNASGGEILIYSIDRTNAKLKQFYQKISQVVAGGGVIPVVTPPTPSVTTTTTTTTTPTGTTTTTTTVAPANTDPTTIQSQRIAQTADGRLYSILTTDTTQIKSDQSVLGYKTFFVQSPISAQERSQI